MSQELHELLSSHDPHCAKQSTQISIKVILSLSNLLDSKVFNGQLTRHVPLYNHMLGLHVRHVLDTSVESFVINIHYLHGERQFVENTTLCRLL